MIKNAFFQRDFSGGLNTTSESWQLQENEIPYSRNMVISKKGSISSSYGFTKSGSSGTSGILGLFPYYLNATRYLVRMYGTQVEYSTAPVAASPTWNNIETLGATGGRFAAVQYNSILWYSDGVNDFRSWNGTAVTTYGSAPKGNIMVSWRASCWMAGVSANPSTLYNSAVDDFTNWASSGAGSTTVNKQDGEAITGLVPLGDTLIVFKERSIWKVSYDFDQTTSSYFYAVTVVTTKRGSVAPRTALLVNNDATAFSNFGVVSVGAEANYSGLRTNVLSANIRGDLKTRLLGGSLNEVAANLSAAEFFEDRLYLSVPIGSSITPSATFLYDSLYDAWMYLEGVGANIFCVYRNSQLEDYLFFGSNDGGVYYFDLVHNQAGTGFTKEFYTSRNNLGSTGTKKEIYEIVITGTKSLGSTIDGTFYRDYASDTFEITDDDLLQDTGGGYVGENVWGNEYFGGTGISSGIPIYRYKKIFYPDERTLMEYQLRFLNDVADEPYSVDSVQVYFMTLDPQESAVTSTS